MCQQPSPFPRDLSALTFAPISRLPDDMDNNAAEIILTERRNEKRKSAPELRDHRPVYWTRLILRMLSFLTCVLIALSLIDAIRNFQKTKHVRTPFREGSGSFPVWPEQEGLKLYPTYVLLGAALVAGVFSLVLVIASFAKIVSTTSRKQCIDADHWLGTKDDEGWQYKHNGRVVDLPRVVGCCDYVLRHVGYL